MNESETLSVLQTEGTWYVYLLRCSDGTIYTGCTGNLEERLSRHKNKQVEYTKSRLPFTLITYIAFTDKYKAYNFERYLKIWSRKSLQSKKVFVIRTSEECGKTKTRNTSKLAPGLIRLLFSFGIRSLTA